MEVILSNFSLMIHKWFQLKERDKSITKMKNAKKEK